VAAATHPVFNTFDEYVRLERNSPVKHEYLAGRIYAIAGGTPDHGRLAFEIGATIGAAIRGGRCRGQSSDVRIRVRTTGLATYPDVSVVCGPRELDPEDENAVTNPTLLVEVTSKSTEEYDRGEKFDHYREIPSLREYVVGAPGGGGLVGRRRETNGEWSTTVARAGQRAELRSVECTIDVDALYDGPADPTE
jgi:Uma2 family endonuclease